MEVIMKFKLKRTKLQIILEIVSFCILAAMFAYLAVRWGDVPDKIPGHYNAMGQVDRIGSKGELLLLPILGWLMYLGMTAVGHFPQIWNTGVTVTQENKERVYRILKSMLSTLKLIVAMVFVYITINSSLAIALPVWFLPIFLIIMFGSVIFFVVKLTREK
jgi:uncharacterized membrane protein